MINLKLHNIMDYVGGVALILAPFIFGFSTIDVARNLFVIGGAVLIAYSLFTRYPFSIAKIIPLGVHMAFDALLGILVMLGPWLFNYRVSLTNGQLTVHFIFGLGLVALVSLTVPKTERQKITRPPYPSASRA